MHEAVQEKCFGEIGMALLFIPTVKQDEKDFFIKSSMFTCIHLW
jgi:hypothetical protein